MQRFGFVGLPNAGKSSLYNALTAASAHAAPYPFSTTDPNVGVARVPDDRLERLAAMTGSREVIHAAVQFSDIGGLVSGASRGEGLGNAFLSQIRSADAIVFVLRAFVAPDVPGSCDPLEHLSVLETELTLADLAGAERQHERAMRAAKGDKAQQQLAVRLGRIVEILAEGTPLYRSELSAAERRGLREHFLLTSKPVLAVVNIGEDQIGSEQELLSQVRSELAGADVLASCVQLEAEAACLGDAERAEMLSGLGLGEGALARLLGRARRLLQLRTFLTTREKESRAWSFVAGSTAPQCAGLIHSDFQRGFIRAETIRWDELLSAGSWATARDQGKVRSEGRDYEVADGDVIEFRFNISRR